MKCIEPKDIQWHLLLYSLAWQKDKKQNSLQNFVTVLSKTKSINGIILQIYKPEITAEAGPHVHGAIKLIVSEYPVVRQNVENLLP